MDDVYIEMDWDMHSWVPLVSRLLPSDTIKIWKQGLRVRMDTTLLDADERTIKRGDRSFLIEADGKSGKVSMRCVDRETKTYYETPLFEPSVQGCGAAVNSETTAEKGLVEVDVDAVMSSELIDVDLTVSKVSFPRASSGWLSKVDRSEVVDGHQCRVYNVADLSMVTRTRREHLSDDDIKENRKRQVEMKKGVAPVYPRRESLPPPTPPSMMWEEYARAPPEVHVGRQMVEDVRNKPLRAVIWMCDGFLLPKDTILRLMRVLVPTSKRIAAVERFIDSRLPPGFPIKLDVPVGMSLSGRITFRNVDIARVDPAVFELPADISLVEAPSGLVDAQREGTSLLDDSMSSNESIISVGSIIEQDRSDSVCSERPTQRDCATLPKGGDAN